jgi:hypothetical protein
MDSVVGLSRRFTNAIVFFASVLAAFRRTPLEDRKPKPVAREIDRLLKADRELERSPDPMASVRKARAYYRRRNWETSQ